MAHRATEQAETLAGREPETRTSTRATPAFRVVIPLNQPTEQTEAANDGYWPAGINYDILGDMPSETQESVSDRLDVLELLDDE